MTRTIDLLPWGEGRESEQKNTMHLAVECAVRDGVVAIIHGLRPCMILKTGIFSSHLAEALTPTLSLRERAG
jgi:hypothetical protein